ncbi:MAG: hypothetical protein RBU21_18515 [FCB group bacterium]|jgi:hypothetical protein|nr:hypothetical protein [FCB group bacterium]
MVHLKTISLRKATTFEDDDLPVFSIDQILALLGGSVQEVVLSIIEAKGKSGS